jgi:hypothetical protein
MMFIMSKVYNWFEKRKLAKQNSQLEEGRAETLLSIAKAKSDIELMAQRPRSTDDDAIDRDLLEKILKELSIIEENTKNADQIDILNHLEEKADEQSSFSAYLCPRREIRNEGHLTFELMEWWGVPRSETARLRSLLEGKIEKADSEPENGRRALHALFSERDEWDSYRFDYEEKMHDYARNLFIAIYVFILFAIATLYYSFIHAPILYDLLIIFGILFAGVAGSCVSVISKLPALEVCPSEKVDSYTRLIFSRISVGTIASLMGCAFLGWGLIPISIQGHSFADVLDINSKILPKISDALRILIILSVPLLFGFSERLSFFERLVFGKMKKSQKSKSSNV